MTSTIRSGAATAESAAYPPEIPLPNVMRSGATPYGSIAHQLPVRPAPHRISSATKSTSCRSQISRIVRKYSGRGVDAPVDEPPTGSAMNAATVSAPARSIASSSAAPLGKGKLVLLARRSREGQQGVPVIRRVERDDMMLAGLAGLDPVLPGELQGGFDRFRAAGEEIELVELARERGGELAGKLLHRAVRERRARDVAELACLARQGFRDLRIRVAEIRDVGAAHGVEVALPLLVVQPAALTAHDAWVAATELPVEDVAIRIAVVGHSSPFPVVRVRGKLCGGLYIGEGAP